jgi:hypothetical protein
MSSQEPYLELQADDTTWIRQRVDGKSDDSLLVIRPAEDDTDVEGHAMTTDVRVKVFDDENDTEGHALTVHFPSREDADAFRRRLVLTGALAGTLVVGAAGGFGLANLVDAGAAGGAAVSAQSAPGMDWSQAERPVQVAAAAAVGSEAGMDWSQAERPGQAAADAAPANAATTPNQPASGGGPTPE